MLLLITGPNNSIPEYQRRCKMAGKKSCNYNWYMNQFSLNVTNRECCIYTTIYILNISYMNVIKEFPNVECNVPLICNSSITQVGFGQNKITKWHNLMLGWSGYIVDYSPTMSKSARMQVENLQQHGEGLRCFRDVCGLWMYSSAQINALLWSNAHQIACVHHTTAGRAISDQFAEMRKLKSV